MAESPAQLKVTDAAVPVAATQAGVSVFDDATLTVTYQASQICKVSECRRVVCRLDVNAGDAANVVEIIPIVSISDTAPSAVTDDEWGYLNETDGSHTISAPGGTQLGNVDFTVAHNFALVECRGLVLRFPASNAASDEHRHFFALNIEDYRFLAFLIADVSGAGTLANLQMDLAKAA
jgi:hypothetical protein